MYHTEVWSDAVQYKAIVPSVFKIQVFLFNILNLLQSNNTSELLVPLIVIHGNCIAIYSLYVVYGCHHQYIDSKANTFYIIFLWCTFFHKNKVPKGTRITYLVYTCIKLNKTGLHMLL